MGQGKGRFELVFRSFLEFVMLALNDECDSARVIFDDRLKANFNIGYVFEQVDLAPTV